MRPDIVVPDYSQIPPELQELSSWLVWQLRLVKGDWSKVPLTADGSGRLAKTNDQSTWRCFDDAVKFAHSADGLGLRLVPPYCGIDLDKCLDKTTGVIAGWAQTLVERFDSYCEISPSGEGLHIIIELTGPLPAGSRKRGGKKQGWEIAIYDDTSPRYFCVTGRVVGDWRTIRRCDPTSFFAEFNSGTWDVTRQPTARSTRVSHSNANGRTAHVPITAADKLALLMRGKWKDLYSSQSEADIALVNYLAKQFNNDVAMIDRVFRVTGLMRDKWNEPRPGGSYGSVTIEKVLAEANKIVVAGEIRRPDMPDAVLDGRLGEICLSRLRAFPLAFAWPSLLTIAGASPSLKQDWGIRGNLFGCLVGHLHSGKSQALDHGLHVLGVSKADPVLLSAKYGSAEGLASDLKDAGSCVRLLMTDELLHLLRKCNIENASFPTFLNTAFYEDKQRGGGKKDIWEIDCRLSIFGGLPEDLFEDAFGASTVGGLYDRFLFGLIPNPHNYDYSPPEGPPERISPCPPHVPRDVWDVLKEWKKDGLSGRLAEICLRAAWICAAVDGRPSLRGCELGPARALAEYQLKVRTFLKPNPGLNFDAQCGASTLNWLKERASSGQWVKRRDLYRGIHAERVGAGVFNRCLQNLQSNDDIELDLKRKLVRLLLEGSSMGR